MSASNTLETMNGFFKELYADNLPNLIPEGLKLLPMISFNSKAKSPGNAYHQPVILG